MIQVVVPMICRPGLLWDDGKQRSRKRLIDVVLMLLLLLLLLLQARCQRRRRGRKREREEDRERVCQASSDLIRPGQNQDQHGDQNQGHNDENY